MISIKNLERVFMENIVGDHMLNGWSARKKKTVSFIIPTINHVELVENCVQSLVQSLERKEHKIEIIVVDDGSSPGVQQDLEEALAAKPVRLICNNQNTGFATTVNRGAAQAGGDYICLVNNDVTFPNDTWLDHMLKGAEVSRASVVGARLLYPNGLLQHAGVYYLPESRTFDHQYRFRPGDYKPAIVNQEALAVTGALLLIDRGIWEELGGMDENFFIALEDVDFSLRAWEIGRKVIYQGDSVAVHHEGLTRGNSIANKDPFWLGLELRGTDYFFSKWGKKLSHLARIYRKKKRLMPAGASASQEQALIWQQLSGKGRLLMLVNEKDSQK